MNRDKTLLLIIVREIDIIIGIIANLDEATFLSSEIAQRAAVMTLINIGEKVKDLSVDFKAGHSDIPWKQISGIRDMAAHTYLKLNFSRIWETITVDLPDLKIKISAII
ncbi:MAG: DUF86 domain-containing protein [Candidatus Cloacimonetes bacterium]|nr:DUF86 domain-containing protein [Candidatus Cloacimonadota bacterium]